MVSFYKFSIIIVVSILYNYYLIIKYMGNYFTTLDEPIKRKFEWKPDIHDKRDHTVAFSGIINHDFIDIRKNCPGVYDQGHLGSCTANAIAFAYEYDQIKQKEKLPFVPSRLFIYYNERDIEGHPNEDTGASLRDGIKSVNTIGVCKEESWPYDIDKFNVRPPDELYIESKKHKGVNYQKVNQTERQLKLALKNGFPIVFGIMVFSSMQTKECAITGIVPMPRETDTELGGHAIALVGYNDDKKQFIFRNSWGTNWGDVGYGYISYDYVLDKNLASDFWIIKKVVDK